MNTYKKYCPNVFVAQCEQEYKKGDLIQITTKYGKEIERLFPEYADQEIITEIIENQMIPEDIPFNKFYHIYQDLHLKKHGEYLQIPVKK